MRYKRESKPISHGHTDFRKRRFQDFIKISHIIYYAVKSTGSVKTFIVGISMRSIGNIDWI